MSSTSRPLKGNPKIWLLDFACLDPSSTSSQKGAVQRGNVKYAYPPGYLSNNSSGGGGGSVDIYKEEEDRLKAQKTKSKSLGAKRGSLSQQQVQQQEQMSKLKLKKAWDTALAPAKTLPMNVFMLWMSGNSVQIFSIIITGMLLFQPVRAVLNISSAFSMYELSISGKPKRFGLFLPKCVFLLVNLITILLGLYKMSSMGLLPTSTSDWLAFEEAKLVKESVGW